MEVLFNKPECPNPDCPNFGEDHRLMSTIIAEEIKKGNVSEGAVAGTRAEMYNFIDAKKLPIIGGRIPGGRSYKDICTKCGREYTFRIERGHVTMPSRPGQLPTFA